MLGYGFSNMCRFFIASSPAETHQHLNMMKLKNLPQITFTCLSYICDRHQNYFKHSNKRTKCPCNYFIQPPFVNVSTADRQVSAAIVGTEDFAIETTGGQEEEISVLSTNGLFKEAALDHFKMNHVFTPRKKNLSKTLLLYFDPTVHAGNRSWHAVCIVGKDLTDDVTVVLGADHFPMYGEAHSVDSIITQDEKIATVIIQLLGEIQKMHQYRFKELCIVLECNAMSMLKLAQQIILEIEVADVFFNNVRFYVHERVNPTDKTKDIVPGYRMQANKKLIFTEVVRRFNALKILPSVCCYTVTLSNLNLFEIIVKQLDKITVDKSVAKKNYSLDDLGLALIMAAYHFDLYHRDLPTSYDNYRNWKEVIT